MIPVSVIVLTKNESENIGKCLSSVSDFEEVFVVDSASTDATVEIAQTFANVRVVPFEWDGRFPKKKQWSLNQVSTQCKWILMLDADEEVTPELARELEKRVHDPVDKAGFFVRYDNYFLGRRLRHGVHSMKLIFFRKGAARFSPGNELPVATMWEVEGNYQPEVEGKVGLLRARAVHHDCKSLYHYFGRHNRYSDLEAAHRLHLKGLKESYPRLRSVGKRILRKMPLGGVPFFLYGYVLKLGFLDGLAGYAFALARLAYFLQIECKVCELKLEPQKYETHYLEGRSAGSGR